MYAIYVVTWKRHNRYEGESHHGISLHSDLKALRTFGDAMRSVPRDKAPDIYFSPEPPQKWYVNASVFEAIEENDGSVFAKERVLTAKDLEKMPLN
jgi:hypothetical protein